MTEEEIKKLQEDLAAEKARADAAEKAKGELEGKYNDLETRHKARGMEFKRFRDMSKEDKDKLSPGEQAALEQADKVAEEQEKLRNEQDAWRKSQREERINKAINERAKGNKELADKIRVNFDGLEASKTAENDEEFASLAEKAVAITRVEAPDLVNGAMGANGRPIEVSETNGFAKTAEGESIASAMGLNWSKPEDKK